MGEKPKCRDAESRKWLPKLSKKSVAGVEDDAVISRFGSHGSKVKQSDARLP
jgi:hypothetical protein